MDTYGEGAGGCSSAKQISWEIYGKEITKKLRYDRCLGELGNRLGDSGEDKLPNKLRNLRNERIRTLSYSLF